MTSGASYDDCPDCGLRRSSLPGLEHVCQYRRLIAALREIGVAPTPEEDATLRWLARWEHGTIDSVVSLLRKASAPKSSPLAPRSAL